MLALIKKNYEKLYAVSLATYFILKPFYLFDSGKPQLADWVLFFLFIVGFINLFTDSGLKDKLWKGKYKTYLYSCGVFLLYVILINIIWSLIFNGDLYFIRSSIFYIFNIFSALMILIIYEKLRDKIYKYIYYSILTTLTIQFVVLFTQVGNDNLFRMQNFFNNPNQLGYFALLCLGIVFFLINKIEVGKISLTLILFTGFLLIFASLSKAAIVSVLLMYPVFLFFSRKNKEIMKANIAFVVIGVIAVILLGIAGQGLLNDNFIYTARRKIINMQREGDDSLAGRGYNRIWEYPRYLFFGAGEGGYERFPAFKGKVMELHSSLGNILFAYGIIGFVLFLLILAHTLDRQIVYYYPIFFMLLYSLTHNGLRQPPFWFLISLVFLNRVNYKGNISETSWRDMFKISL